MKFQKESPLTLLQLRIVELKLEKRIQEEAIADAARSILQSLHPAALAKESVIELAHDRDVQVTTTQTALKMGTRFLIFKVLGRYSGVLGATAAAVVGNLSDKYVNRATPGLLNVVGGLFSGKKDEPKEEIDDQAMYEPLHTNR